MRSVRPLLVAGAIVLAAGIGTTVALTTRSGPAAPRGGQPAATPVAAAPARPAASTTPTTTVATRTDAAGAVAAARSFLARELGMTAMAAGPFRSTGVRSGEVGFRHRFGEGGRPLPRTGPAAVTVRLERLPGGWWVLGVRGRSIQVDTPGRLQRIGSPVTVAGTAEVYEGTVYVKVTQDRPGRDVVLGEGFVTGGGDAPGAFRGQIPFRRPAAGAGGWVICYEASADGSNGILQASAVRVGFAATPAPRILGITTSPRLRVEGGWLELPPGPGTVVFSVDAVHARRVRFVLTPTGTGTAPYARVLGEDGDPRDGFGLRWNYPAEGLSAHLTVQAIGPGGSAERLLDIAH
jgi:hypothetical protein